MSDPRRPPHAAYAVYPPPILVALASVVLVPTISFKLSQLAGGRAGRSIILDLLDANDCSSATRTCMRIAALSARLLPDAADLYVDWRYAPQKQAATTVQLYNHDNAAHNTVTLPGGDTAPVELRLVRADSDDDNDTKGSTWHWLVLTVTRSAPAIFYSVAAPLAMTAFRIQMLPIVHAGIDCVASGLARTALRFTADHLVPLMADCMLLTPTRYACVKARMRSHRTLLLGGEWAVASAIAVAARSGSSAHAASLAYTEWSLHRALCVDVARCFFESLVSYCGATLAPSMSVSTSELLLDPRGAATEMVRCGGGAGVDTTSAMTAMGAVLQYTGATAGYALALSTASMLAVHQSRGIMEWALGAAPVMRGWRIEARVVGGGGDDGSSGDGSVDSGDNDNDGNDGSGGSDNVDVDNASDNGDGNDDGDNANVDVDNASENDDADGDGDGAAYRIDDTGSRNSSSSSSSSPSSSSSSTAPLLHASATSPSSSLPRHELSPPHTPSSLGSPGRRSPPRIIINDEGDDDDDDDADDGPAHLAAMQPLQERDAVSVQDEAHLVDAKIETLKMLIGLARIPCEMALSAAMMHGGGDGGGGGF